MTVNKMEHVVNYENWITVGSFERALMTDLSMISSVAPEEQTETFGEGTHLEYMGTEDCYTVFMIMKNALRDKKIVKIKHYHDAKYATDHFEIDMMNWSPYKLTAPGTPQSRSNNASDAYYGDDRMMILARFIRYLSGFNCTVEGAVYQSWGGQVGAYIVEDGVLRFGKIEISPGMEVPLEPYDWQKKTSSTGDEEGKAAC